MLLLRLAVGLLLLLLLLLLCLAVGFLLLLLLLCLAVGCERRWQIPLLAQYRGERRPSERARGARADRGDVAAARLCN